MEVFWEIHIASDAYLSEVIEKWAFKVNGPVPRVGEVIILKELVKDPAIPEEFRIPILKRLEESPFRAWQVFSIVHKPRPNGYVIAIGLHNPL